MTPEELAERVTLLEALASASDARLIVLESYVRTQQRVLMQIQLEQQLGRKSIEAKLDNLASRLTS